MQQEQALMALYDCLNAAFVCVRARVCVCASVCARFPPAPSLALLQDPRMLPVSVMLRVLHEASLCSGKAGLQLAPAMCESQWVPQHSVQEASCLIDWDEHH